MLNMFNGLRVISDAKMVEDSGERSWARVRSHGRAKRRLKRGYRQNIDIIWVPKKEFLRFGDAIVGHPAMIQKLKEATLEQQS
jgi:hypothetical protein